MTYVNDGLPFIVNSIITEYDIKSGNTSIMKHFKLIPDADIQALEKLPKQERVVRVGLLMRNNKDFSMKLEAGFNAVVQEFIRVNDLDPDVDILAIRRDAVFIVNKIPKQTKIGDHIHFVKKNQYHAALQIGPQLEFYFGKDGKVDIKNFVQADKDTEGALEKLKPGMIYFLQEFIEVAEGCNMNRAKVYKWLKDFCTFYKDRDLDIEYYREFTRNAAFRVDMGDEPRYMEDVPDYMLEDLNISFNYENIIIPLLQILI